MLMRTDPVREVDRIVQQVFGAPATWSRPAVIPMDAYRSGDEYVVALDLPGVDPEAVDIQVERNTLTVKAERRPAPREGEVHMEIRERPLGVFTRQLLLGDTLDTDRITAEYDAGVLTLRIPVTEKAKPRKIAVSPGRRQISA